MDENTKNEIDALLTEREVKEERETKEQAFLREFINIRDSIAKPAMEEILEYLEKKGLGSSIEEQEQDHSQQARKAASITIRFTMKSEGYKPPHEYPHLSIISDTTQQKIRFHESTIGPNHGGHGGPAGECAINELSKELIHNKTMNNLSCLMYRI